MTKKTAEIHLSDSSSKNAVDLWEQMILPLIYRKEEVCGTDEAQQLFFDLMYLMMLAHIDVSGFIGEKNIRLILKNVLEDMKQNDLTQNIETSIESNFYAQSDTKVS